MIGVLEGEGVGPEVILAALRVLAALESCGGERFEIRFGGRIGLEAEAHGGAPLSAEVVQFCRDVFADGGVILTGPGGGSWYVQSRSGEATRHEGTVAEPAVTVTASATDWEAVQTGRLGHIYEY